MERQRGYIDITVEKFSPEPATDASGAGIPPRMRTALGMGESGGGNVPPSIATSFGEWDELDPTLATEGEMFAAMNAIVKDALKPGYTGTFFRDIERIEKKYFTEKDYKLPISEEHEDLMRKWFIKEGKIRGIIKENPVIYAARSLPFIGRKIR